RRTKKQNAAVFLYKTLRYHSVDCEQTKPPGKIFLSSQTYQDGAVALVIFQEYLYILCEFVEHSFETIGSKRHRLSNKMYKYFRFRLMRQLHFLRKTKCLLKHLETFVKKE